MNEYSLTRQGNAVVLQVAPGVGTITLNATKLDFLIGSLQHMRETMSPPPPPLVQPPKGAELPVNWSGAFELPPMEELRGGSLAPGGPDQSAFLSLLYGSSHRPRPCEVRVPLPVARKLVAYLQTMLADARQRGFS